MVVVGVSAGLLGIIPDKDGDQYAQNEGSHGIDGVNLRQATLGDDVAHDLRGYSGRQGEADGHPAHGDALFPGEPVGNHVQGADVAEAHAAHSGNGQTYEIDGGGGGMAPEQAGDAGNQQGNGPAPTDGDLAGQNAPQRGTCHGDPGSDGGEAIEHAAVPAVLVGKYVYHDVQ